LSDHQEKLEYNFYIPLLNTCKYINCKSKSMPCDPMGLLLEDKFDEKRYESYYKGVKIIINNKYLLKIDSKK
jgi:putative ribosome biogenesis GTPase RsgA